MFFFLFVKKTFSENEDAFNGWSTAWAILFWLPHQRTGPVCAVRYRKTFFVSRLSFFVKLVPRFRDLASRSGILWHRLFAALCEHVGRVSNLSVSRAVKERSRARVEERTEPATTAKVATLA